MKYRLMKDHGGKLNAYVLLLMGVCASEDTCIYCVHGNRGQRATSGVAFRNDVHLI